MVPEARFSDSDTQMTTPREAAERSRRSTAVVSNVCKRGTGKLQVSTQEQEERKCTIPERQCVKY